jgi:hypothetical protein
MRSQVESDADRPFRGRPRAVPASRPTLRGAPQLAASPRGEGRRTNTAPLLSGQEVRCLFPGPARGGTCRSLESLSAAAFAAGPVLRRPRAPTRFRGSGRASALNPGSGGPDRGAGRSEFSATTPNRNSRHVPERARAGERGTCQTADFSAVGFASVGANPLSGASVMPFDCRSTRLDTASCEISRGDLAASAARRCRSAAIRIPGVGMTPGLDRSGRRLQRIRPRFGGIPPNAAPEGAAPRRAAEPSGWTSVGDDDRAIVAWSTLLSKRDARFGVSRFRGPTRLRSAARRQSGLPVSSRSRLLGALALRTGCPSSFRSWPRAPGVHPSRRAAGLSPCCRGAFVHRAREPSFDDSASPHRTSFEACAIWLPHAAPKSDVCRADLPRTVNLFEGEDFSVLSDRRRRCPPSTSA